MDFFRDWNLRILNLHFYSFGEKIEKLVYNASISRIREVNTSPTVEEFRIIYDWFTQIVLEERYFILHVIESQSIKPSNIINILIQRLKSKEDYLSKILPEKDARISMRYHVLRELSALVGSDLGSRLEMSISENKKSKHEYKIQSLKIISNLKNVKTNFKNRILNGIFLAEDTGNATHKDLWPELWECEYMQPNHRAIITRQEESIVKDSLIKCYNCKNNTVETTEFQTRSADEPMTIFCNCTTCGKRWRM
jgi:DNA-directed RNA polymerase subunit M/transcription elongation factor TFIIS